MFFKRETKIHLAKNLTPITFTHRKDIAKSEDFLPHLNNYVEIYVYISGDVDYIVEEEYISLSYGDIIVISPHEVHVPLIKSNSSYERLYMLIPLDTFSHFPFDPLLRYSAFKGHKISLDENERKQFFHILHHISELAESQENESKNLLQAGLFLQIHGMLLHALERKADNDAPQISSNTPRQIRDILNYIGEHAKEIDSVDAIAKHFYISPQYLSAFFKKQVGINANEYLRIKKTSLAKMFLENGKSVAETGYECGFSDSSHFIKTFKRYVGMTPKQYQNSFLKSKK